MRLSTHLTWDQTTARSPGDRRQIFNAVYSISLPSPLHGNRLVRGAVNGWQLSGITQLQSGANLTGNFGGYNYAMNLNGAILPGTENVVNPGAPNGIPINNQSILGTPDVQLNPLVTCNPRANLAPHQFINGSFRCAHGCWSEWSDRTPGDLRTSLFQFRSGTLQEFPDQ